MGERRGRRKGITRAATAVALAAGVFACAGPPGPPPIEAGEAAAARLRATPPPEGSVVVRLAFDAGADLDLYVTGPRSETVYFANSPSKIGGRLEADRRCEDDAPEGAARIETVVFPDPWPGAYRVGVDFPEACREGHDAARFAVDVHSAGGRREGGGWVARGEFEPIVLEWVEPAP